MSIIIRSQGIANPIVRKTMNFLTRGGLIVFLPKTENYKEI